ncbi:MAG: hypothetical protein R3E32_22715 [Chitinophagales bacterium]
MNTLQVRKMNIIEIIMGIDNDEALAKIENQAIKVKQQITHKNKLNVFDAVKPIRSNVSLEQIMSEQNYKPISYKEFRKLADKLELEESIEELLALLSK